MSYDRKGFWILKNNEHVMGDDQAYHNPARGDSKRSHSWFVDAAHPEMFPNKKHVIQDPITKRNVGVPSWENSSVFHSDSNQFMDRLLGSEMPRSLIFGERDRSDFGSQPKDMTETYMENASVQLSISSGMEVTGNCFTTDGITKLRVGRVKDTMGEHGHSDSHSLHSQRKVEPSPIQASSQDNESSFVSIHEKEGINATLGGHPYGNVESNIMAFGEINNDEHGVGPDSQAVGGYHSYVPSTVQTTEILYGKEPEASHANVSALQLVTPRSEYILKNKTEAKTLRKEAPTSFPSNVRSLISTGMLDGVPVKYISLSREELQGIIQGSGYLCGCQDCNFTKTLNAYAFERHAGCKTKHPNNHIYFENGKTIYQIVQELRNTPERMLFDVIQTVFGSPINQKAFRSWKESFQAATRELQRIYGKEDINL